MGIAEKMINIQSKLIAPKNQYNSFGRYSYRSCESILEAVKPLLKEYNLFMYITDEIFTEDAGDDRWVFVNAVVTIIDAESGEQIKNAASARHSSSKKGADDAQVTGATSSYARKYALNGLFLIDDNKDADTDEHQIERSARADRKARAEDPKISTEKIEQLENIANEANVSIEAICKRFNLTTLQDMTISQFASAIRMLEATMKKQEAK